MENQSIVTKTELLQSSSYQVWVQAMARTLYQIGHVSIVFFIPLIFVNQLGFGATAVGMAIGSGSLAGVVGHFLGGYLADSPRYGRKRTLLFSAGLSIIAAIVLALLPNIPMLYVANLIMGLASGCYWTAADAAVMDVTKSEQRSKCTNIDSTAESSSSQDLNVVVDWWILFSLGNSSDAISLCWCDHGIQCLVDRHRHL